MSNETVGRPPVDEIEAIRQGQLLEFIAQRKQGKRRKSIYVCHTDEAETPPASSKDPRKR